MNRPWPNRFRKGTALIEFALTAPILTMLLLGGVDIGTALMAKFKVASAAQTAVDLVTQSATMSINDIANYVAAGGDALAPFSASNLTLRITNVVTTGLGITFVYWSCGQGNLPPLAGGTIVTSTPSGTPVSSMLRTLPGFWGLIPVTGFNTSYVMVEAQYTFVPPAGFVFKTNQTFSTNAYAMPRVSTYVGATNILGTTTPLSPSLSLLSMTQTSGSITCKTPIV